MGWEVVGNLVSKAAPMLCGILTATGVGAPIGAAITAAGSLIASICGTDPEPQAVAAAIQANPELALKIKQAEFDHQDKIMAWQTSMIQAEVANVTNARNSEVEKARLGYAGAWATPIVAVIVTVGFFVMLALLLTGSVKADNAAAMLLLGTLSAGFGAVINYYLGSSSSSVRKDNLLLQATPAQGGK
jgi:disulfide bond formation protein DsbB